jgi:nucleotide-binding universal stress UspA family protein
MVSMHRKVVVAYRPDTHGENAVALARMLASARLVAKVVIVEVVHSGSASAEAEQRLAGLVGDWPQPLSVSARVVAAHSVSDALVSVAREEQADAVVLGSTHRGRPGRVFMGTTFENIAREATWPIVVAPEGFASTTTELKKIGVAYDGSDESQAALEWAVGAASEVGAGLRLLAVVEPPPPPAETWAGSMPGEAWGDGLSLADTTNVVDVLRERRQHELEDARATIGSTPVETVTIVGDVLHELRDAAADLDMLVLGSHGRKRLDDLLVGGVARRLAHSCVAPLVLVPKDRAGLGGTPVA